MDKRIVSILKKEGEEGLSITDLVSKTKLTRSAVRTGLARLEGAKKVKLRKVGMTKLYSLKDEN